MLKDECDSFHVLRVKTLTIQKPLSREAMSQLGNVSGTKECAINGKTFIESKAEQIIQL